MSRDETPNSVIARLMLPREDPTIKSVLEEDLRLTDAALERKGPAFARRRFNELRPGKREGRKEILSSLRPLRRLRSIVTF
jgi:hypothetical protein